MTNASKPRPKSRRDEGSTNHDGYEQAMRDVIGVLDAADTLGGTGLASVRFAVKHLRKSNLRSRTNFISTRKT